MKAAQTPTKAAQTPTKEARTLTKAAQTPTKAAIPKKAAQRTAKAVAPEKAAQTPKKVEQRKKKAAQRTTKAAGPEKAAQTPKNAAVPKTAGQTPKKVAAPKKLVQSTTAGQSTMMGQSTMVGQSPMVGQSVAVSASQIDTTVTLSQGTLNTLFDSSSESDTELSPSAVPRAFGMSPSDIPTETAHFEAAVNLQLLSEASGLVSAAELDEEQTTPVRTLHPRTVVKYDVNFVPEDGDEANYESFDSSESEEGDIGDEEDEPERGGDADEDDVLSESDAVQMNEACIALLMIGNTTLTKKEIKHREAALRATAWTPTSSDFEVSDNAYVGMGDEMAQPVPELLALADPPPLQTFLYFMPKSLWL
ncbi:hypothetical protein PF006_g21169 [Phytophthora fragariae]|uniref:Uncharacterized protein n=1 Tax=Phytophthora fragariae TaxID=53985 RepID=A0A6A3S1L9_9STRA|nr:hypothetical protein PF006_g21169 [Phytophthora fragariae]